MATQPTGRPAKTLAEKVRLGFPGHHPRPDRSKLIVLPPALVEPDPMRPLGQAGLALWKRVWASGALWLARDVDPDVVLVMCEQIDERQALRAQVIRDGDWRERTQLRNLDAQILATLGSLGFNPAERARMNVAEVAKPTRLEGLLAERQQSRRG